MTNPTALKAIAEAATEAAPMANDHDRRGVGERLWQPIETAPRDGTIFLAYGRWYRALAVKWSEGYERHGIVVEGRFTMHDGRSTGLRWEGVFTHWMPLPASPTLEES